MLAVLGCLVCLLPLTLRSISNLRLRPLCRSLSITRRIEMQG